MNFRATRESEAAAAGGLLAGQTGEKRLGLLGQDLVDGLSQLFLDVGRSTHVDFADNSLFIDDRHRRNPRHMVEFGNLPRLVERHFNVELG